MKFSISKRAGYGKKALTCLFSLLMFAGAVAIPVSGEVTGLEISPADPVVGDTLRISGSAAPKEEVEILIFFEKDVPVSGGVYAYELQDVVVPDFNNRFTVTAEGVEDLNIRRKLIFWTNRSAQASEGTAFISEERVPPETYQLRIDGRAKSGKAAVKLKITELRLAKASTEGKFSYIYGTGAAPPGNIEIKVGDYTATVTLRPAETPGSEPAPAGTAQEIPGSGSFIVYEASKGRENSSITETANEKSPAWKKEYSDTVLERIPDLKQIFELEQASDLETPAPESKNSGQGGMLMEMGYLLGGIGAGLTVLFAYSKIR